MNGPTEPESAMLSRLTAVHSVNSPDFIRTVLRLYNEKTLFVILKSDDQLQHLEGTEVSEIIVPEQGHGWIHFEQTTFSDSDEPAQVTFTSGTEGQPKGIVLSHRALNDVVSRLCEITGINNEIREYVGVPAGYSFGLGRFRAIAAVGGSAYIPQHGFDLTEIARMLEEGAINAISAVPTLWKTVIANPSLFEDIGDRLRWIEIGSQYMPRSDKEQLKQLFPTADITQHYGLTEASRSTFLSISSTQGNVLESVGTATGETATRISEDGHIEIYGPHIASGRLTATGIEPLTNSQGWLRTNDKGELRDGYLFYLGRADDLINCGGIKINPDQLESTLFRMLNIDRGLGVGRFQHSMRGDGIVVAIERETGLNLNQVKSAASKALQQQELRAGDGLRVIEVDQLPRTETGKIQRRMLAEQLAAHKENQSGDIKGSDQPIGPSGRSAPLQARLVNIWKQVLKTDHISLDENFYDNGGDSLTAISMMLTLEKAGIEKRIASKIFDGESIREIVNAEEHGKIAVRTERISERVTGDIINIVRGILVLILIAIHFLPGIWERVPVDVEQVNQLLYPFYRFGTPGFALVFGMGVGFFYFKQMASGNAHVWRRVRLSAIIVGIGVLILGTFRFSVFITSPEDPPSPLFSAVFFSVLTYYLVAVLSIPLWFRVAYRKNTPILAALCASVLSFILYLVVDRAIGQEQLSFGPAELIRLMFEAKYNYFRMTSIVMIGIAIGLHFRQQTNLSQAARFYTLSGILIFITATLLPFDMGQPDRWFMMKDAELFAIIGYTGVVLVFLGLTTWIRQCASRDGVNGKVLRVLAACGVLSLPSYVAHGLVIPGKNIVVNLTGISSSVALLGSLGIFFVVAAIAIRKVYTLYG